MTNREWTAIAQEELLRGHSVQVQARGHSMSGHIEDGDRVTLEPVLGKTLTIGDLVLARVRSRILVLHQILDIQSNQYLIGTSERQDGWVAEEDIFGIVVGIQTDFEE